MEIIRGKRGLSSGQTAWNLEDYVMQLFEEKKSSTPEFETIVRIYGKQKITLIWEKWLMLRGNKSTQRDSSDGHM